MRIISSHTHTHWRRRRRRRTSIIFRCDHGGVAVNSLKKNFACVHRRSFIVHRRRCRRFVVNVSSIGCRQWGARVNDKLTDSDTHTHTMPLQRMGMACFFFIARHLLCVAVAETFKFLLFLLVLQFLLFSLFMSPSLVHSPNQPPFSLLRRQQKQVKIPFFLFFNLLFWISVDWNSETILFVAVRRSSLCKTVEQTVRHQMICGSKKHQISPNDWSFRLFDGLSHVSAFISFLFLLFYAANDQYRLSLCRYSIETILSPMCRVRL